MPPTATLPMIVPKAWCVPSTVKDFVHDYVLVDPEDENSPELLTSALDRKVFRNITAGKLTGQNSDSTRLVLADFTNTEKAAFLNFAARTKTCKEAKMDAGEHTADFVETFNIPTAFGPDCTEVLLRRMVDGYYRYITAESCSNAIEMGKDTDGKKLVYFKTHTREWVVNPKKDWVKMKQESSLGVRAGRYVPLDDKDREIGVDRFMKAAMVVLRESGIWDEIVSKSYPVLDGDDVKARDNTTTTTTETTSGNGPKRTATYTKAAATTTATPAQAPASPAKPAPTQPWSTSTAYKTKAATVQSPPVPIASKPLFTHKHVTPPTGYTSASPEAPPKTPKPSNPFLNSPLTTPSRNKPNSLCRDTAIRQERLAKQVKGISQFVLDPSLPDSQESRLAFLERLHGRIF